jgi:hypothetical protein
MRELALESESFNKDPSRLEMTRDVNIGNSSPLGLTVLDFTEELPQVMV